MRDFALLIQQIVEVFALDLEGENPIECPDGRAAGLSVEERRIAMAPLLDDIALLERVTGNPYDDWRGDAGRGEFSGRWRG